VRYLSSPSTVGPGTPNPYVTKEVLETPAGPGPQNYLNSDFPGQPSDFALINGVQEMYLRKHNTVYISNIWGPYITKGRKPGAFIYRRPKDTFFWHLLPAVAS
jgi:hypothetical protein